MGTFPDPHSLATWRNQVDAFSWYAHVMKHKEKLYALHCFCTVARGIQAIQSSGILHLKELMQEYQT